MLYVIKIYNMYINRESQNSHGGNERCKNSETAHALLDDKMCLWWHVRFSFSSLSINSGCCWLLLSALFNWYVLVEVSVPTSPVTVLCIFFVSSFLYKLRNIMLCVRAKICVSASFRVISFCEYDLYLQVSHQTCTKRFVSYV